jgi:hypothetical protein
LGRDCHCDRGICGLVYGESISSGASTAFIETTQRTSRNNSFYSALPHR